MMAHPCKLHVCNTECSTCGKEGRKLADCSANADTQCRCALGFTGANCTDSCEVWHMCTVEGPWSMTVSWARS